MIEVSLITLGSPHQLTGGYLFHQRMADRGDEHGARLTFVSVREGSWLRQAASGRQAMRVAAAADVIVVDSIAAGAAAMWPSGGRPLAAMVHQPPGGMERRGAWRRALALVDAALYRRCRLVMIASESLRDHVRAARLMVVAPGRDSPGGADADDRLDLRAGRAAALLSVGNWVARKGTLDLLEAVARLPAGAATLHLVGRQDADRAYAARVVVHGPMPRDEVSRYYAAADVFVLPSYEEPYGTVYGEAMAAGLPVAGWHAGNLPHLARDGEEGVVVAPGDIGALAAGLERLCLDGPYRARLSAAARRRAEAELPTWDDTAARFFAALREVARSAR